MNEPFEKTIECKRVRRRLSAYVDNELPTTAAGEVERHLVICHACRKEEQAIRALWEALEDSLSLQASPLIEDTVFKRIDGEGWESKAPKRFIFRRLFPVSAAVALACLIVGGYMARALVEKEAGDNRRHAIASSLDIFTPAPKGTLADGYFAMVRNTGM